MSEDTVSCTLLGRKDSNFRLSDPESQSDSLASRAKFDKFVKSDGGGASVRLQSVSLRSKLLLSPATEVRRIPARLIKNNSSRSKRFLLENIVIGQRRGIAWRAFCLGQRRRSDVGLRSLRPREAGAHDSQHF